MCNVKLKKRSFLLEIFNPSVIKKNSCINGSIFDNTKIISDETYKLKLLSLFLDKLSTKMRLVDYFIERQSFTNKNNINSDEVNISGTKIYGIVFYEEIGN